MKTEMYVTSPVKRTTRERYYLSTGRNKKTEMLEERGALLLWLDWKQIGVVDSVVEEKTILAIDYG